MTNSAIKSEPRITTPSDAVLPIEGLDRTSQIKLSQADEIGDTVLFHLKRYVAFKNTDHEALAALVMARSDMQDFFDDEIDDLKSSLGADVANECGDDNELQEEAIGYVENWIAENISNASAYEQVRAVIWNRDLPEGKNRIEAEIARLDHRTSSQFEPG